MSARLPKGPPPVMVELRFTPRELEYIDLRFGQILSLEKVAQEMKICRRTVQWFSEKIYMRLGMMPEGAGRYENTIRITKLLIKLGFVKL